MLPVTMMATNGSSDATLFYGADWIDAVSTVLDVLTAQQKSSADDAKGPCGPAYTFQRTNLVGQGPLDTLLNSVGRPAAYTGMIRSGFRPSDDACTFSYLIPANAMAAVELKHTATLLRALPPLHGHDTVTALATRCDKLANEISKGIQQYGLVNRPELGGTVYAYEVDGFGSAHMMDDANIPSLL